MICPFDESTYPSTYGNKGPYVATPPTTDACLVFSYDRRNNKFDKNFYSPALTDGRVSFQQLESFLGEVEQIMKKKLGPVKKILTLFTCFAFTGVIAFALMMFSMMSDDFDDDYDSTTDTSGYDDVNDEMDSLFAVMMAFIFGLVFYGVIFSLYSRKRTRKATKAVKALIEKNYPVFAAQGLRWNMPKHFPAWIELWKDYKGQGQGQEQGQCMCGQMTQPYGAFTVPIQGQMTQQPQYQQYSQYPQYPQQKYHQQLQQVQPHQVLPIFQNPSINMNYQNKPLSQPLLNQTQSQGPKEYVPPTASNYPSLDH